MKTNTPNNKERFQFIYSTLCQIGDLTYSEVLEVLQAFDYETKGKTKQDVANILIRDGVAASAILPWITE